MIDYLGNKITWVPTLKSSKKPKYILIAESIERDIQNGKLLHGDRLPPQRVIANFLGINHGTVTRAYKLCEEKGLLTGIVGKGTFVSSNAGLPVQLLTDHNDKNIISLGMVLPLYETNTFIEKQLKSISELMDYNIALKYCPPEGHIKHRYIAAKWLNQYKIESSPDNIIITSGTQNALSIILVSLFSKSDRIIVDELTYTGLKSLAKYLGIILIPVQSDESGINIELLEQTCKREKAKGIYLMPDCHNPTSVTVGEKKREEIGKIISRHNLLLIEDGACSFTIKNKLTPISAFVPDRGFYIFGTSKALNPTLRISYIVSPSKYTKKLQQGINNLNWMASPYNAEMVSLLQTTMKYEEIVKVKLAILEERNTIFDQIFNNFKFTRSKTSLFRYLEIPDEYSSMELERIALEHGVQIFSTNRFLVGKNNNCNAIRISVSSTDNIKELEMGLKIVREIIK
ncbi:aminotransferase-like domain-containing protein [Calidifontibacillus oryziterrae]|uniref:aminotransferase-like domain-containing protein n=1 Tax=Calidifontibacillus oryziterrae TaxID=1191699 RepID=UPI0002D97755|nr:PLP-dependent aminotransferase family protein [Calidifontibacillus oryziterrae]